MNALVRIGAPLIVPTLAACAAPALPPAAPLFALTFTPDNVVVARSGDMAYETGTCSMTLTGPEDKPLPEQGHYVVIWRKQPDGTWKAAVDVPVSDPPPTGETAGETD